MGYLRSFLGYLGASLALPILLATFMGGNFWAKQLVAVTGIQVTPWYTGGKVSQIIDHGRYRTLIHRAVFEGLICQRRQGFVQIDWQPKAGALPDPIDENIDYNRDGVADFRIELHPKKNRAELTDKKSNVLRIERVYAIENERAVRIVLKNQKGRNENESKDQ
jgi:hypothetical protein